MKFHISDFEAESGARWYFGAPLLPQHIRSFAHGLAFEAIGPKGLRAMGSDHLVLRCRVPGNLGV